MKNNKFLMEQLEGYDKNLLEVLRNKAKETGKAQIIERTTKPITDPLRFHEFFDIVDIMIDGDGNIFEESIN